MKSRLSKLEKTVIGAEGPPPKDLDARLSRKCAYELWVVSGQPGDTVEDFEQITERDMLVGFLRVYGGADATDRAELLEEFERDYGPQEARRIEIEAFGEAQPGIELSGPVTTSPA